MTTFIWIIGGLLAATLCVLAGYFLAWRAGEQHLYELQDGWIAFMREQQAQWRTQWRTQWRDAQLEALAGRDTEELQATPTPPFSRPLAARPAGQRSVPRPPISHPLRDRQDRQVGR